MMIMTLLVPSVSARSFIDVPEDHVYREPISIVSDAGIFAGYADGRFDPDQPINRAELVKVLMEAHDVHGGGTYCFPDVAIEWYAEYVCMAKSMGMITGYPDGMFKPARSVSYVEAAALIVREYDGMLPQSGEMWYMPYVERLAEWNGVPPTVQSMDSTVTRGEVAYMLWRAGEAHGSNLPPRDSIEREADLRLEMSANRTQIKPGETATLTLSIENRGDDDIETDLEVSVDPAVRILSAPSATIQGSRVLWDDIEVDDDDEEIFTLIVQARLSAKSGLAYNVRAEVEDEAESLTLNVQGTPYQTTFGDPVIYWNEQALKANAIDHSGTYGSPEQGGPGRSSRALAIVQAAVFDAVNSLDASYRPYLTAVPVPSGASVSPDAAVASAAYRVLFALYPKQRAEIDAAFQSFMSQVPAGAERELGRTVGELAAQNILAARNNDGSDASDQYTPSLLPGRHREDPINPRQGFIGPKWSNVRPFALTSPQQFRSVPPPALTSAEYAAAFNEVKMLGGNGTTTPTLRTADQTQIAMFWMYDGAKDIGTPPRLYNQIVRTIALQKGNTIVENARLFALVNLAMADSGIASWETKYLYDVWRPIVGIREADQGTGPTGLGDGNPLTQGDTTWTPLGAGMNKVGSNNFTPAFPAYTSGHATFGAATFRILERFYGTDEIPFTFVSDELNGITVDANGRVRPYAPRRFARLSDAARENAQSRIYLGVHWQFDATAGITQGNSVADYVFQSAMLPQ